MKRRKMVALIIIFVGLTGFFVILGGRHSNLQSKNPEPTSWSNPTLAFTAQPLNPPSFNIGGLPPIESSNLTENLAKTYAQKIFKQNEEIGTVSGGSQIVLPSFDINEMAFDGLGLELFSFSPFESKDIKLSAENSIKSQIIYLESLDTALRKNFGWLKKDIGTAIDEYLKEGKNQTLKDITNNIPVFVDDLLKISVPPSFKSFHLQILNLWKKKQIIYQVILNSKADPLKAFLALQQLPDLIQKDISLNSILVDWYNELKSNP